MGRQAYLNRLALGRSPYEAPENTNAELTAPTQQRFSAFHSDGYVQQYDERAHPVNLESKSLGRNLRRAKNDILSTMGIVVSGKDGKTGISSEKHNVDMIATENDYGLVVATLDQALVFLGSWWTTSLIGRVQTFRRYAYAPLMKFVTAERSSIGLLGFYFSGIPAWAISTGVSVCRHNPLESLISTLQEWLLHFSPSNALDRLIRRSCSLIHSATRGALLVVAVQAYMYSLLQSLHLIHPYSLPGLRLLIPFGELTSMQLPPLPAEFSLHSLGTFGFNVLTAPPLLVYLCFCLRPVFEIRLYRLIRRRLPKPTHADEASIEVAFDNDLIDWMVPSLGRRSEEEITRARLTLGQDISNEISHFKWWALSWFGIKPKPRIEPDREVRRALNQYEQRIESLLHWAEVLRNELSVAQTRGHLTQQRITDLQELSGDQTHNHESARPNLPGPSVSAQISEPTFDTARALSTEEGRLTLSPDEISDDGLVDMPPLGQTRSVPSIEPTSREAHRRGNVPSNRRDSRSNTLFSRPSSPESSPPTSPRVRASLIHQNSDIITMQLELLSHRNSDAQNQPTARDDNQNQITNRNWVPEDRRAIAEFLDSFISNEGHLSTLLSSDTIDSDGLSGLTAGVSPRPDNLADPVLPSQPGPTPENPASNSLFEPPVSSIANILPDDVEEPPAEPARTQSETGPIFDDPTDLEPLPTRASPSAPRQPHQGGEPHRVTILSAHPLDSLASHLASVVTTAMFIPLESIFLRSLASSYLASQGSSLALHSDVRRPLGFWPGGGSRSEIIPYLGKLGLAVGIQAALNASVWGVVTGAVIKIGKTFCNWGKL